MQKCINSDTVALSVHCQEMWAVIQKRRTVH